LKGVVCFETIDGDEGARVFKAASAVRANFYAIATSDAFLFVNIAWSKTRIEVADGVRRGDFGARGILSGVAGGCAFKSRESNEFQQIQFFRRCVHGGLGRGDCGAFCGMLAAGTRH
jgi:hypothetical protein